MRVLITQKVNGVFSTIDYTRYVLDGSLTIEDSINVPTLISFSLSPVDNTFIVPKRSAYVQILSDVYAPSGGYGSGKILATGVITNEPARTYLGLNSHLPKFNFQQLTYDIQITSDEWFLNCNTVPFIPAFVNQTDSQILASLAQALKPGYFDVTSFMASGTLVPYFAYDPSQTWSDIAKTFADANRYHYKVINKKIYYQPFGDQPLGIAYDDQNMSEKQLFPLELTTQVVSVPPVNDCTVLGAVEPQANWDNYFVGDGFTSNFPLKHQVFDGTTADLLSDDWTESDFATGTWIVNDPTGVITLIDAGGNPVGALNVVQKGLPGVYQPIQNATFIQAQNGLELGGGLNLQHGQVTFNDTASGGGGLIGAIFAETASFAPGNCIAGFGVSGQAAVGVQSVVAVQVVSNVAQITINYTGTNPQMPLVPGNVIQLRCTSPAFLNFAKTFVESIQGPITLPNGANWILTCPLNAPDTPLTVVNSGTAQALVNDVLVTASGAAGIAIQPIYNGQFVGPQILSQANHQYVLQTWVGARAQNRYTRPYTNLTQTATYGNNNLASSGDLTFVITDVNLGQYVIEQQNPLFGLFPAAPAPVVTKFTISNANLPSFAVYTLISAIDLNVSINYTVLSLPPQGELWVQSLTGASGGNLPWLPSQLTAPIVYQLGFGMVNQTAQIGQSGEVNELQFYTDDIPSVGARIRFQSWAAGQSVARVQDPIAIASEATSSGDNGIRAAIMQNLSPQPRTSVECQAAAAAAILDREYPQFQGTYTVQTIPYRFETLFSPSIYQYPWSGRFFYINALVRGVSGQNFFANTVRTQVVEMRQEVLTISIDYGPDLYLERLLPTFLEREQNLLVPTQTVAPPNPITLSQVLNAFLPTLDNAQVTAQVNSLTGNYVVIDLGTIPVTGCEVRSVDSGWGVADQGRIGLFTTKTFTVPRTIRDQTWYLRLLNGSKFSMFSKALRVVAPLIPSSPTLVAANSSQIVLDYAGDVRDIYGLTLVAPGLSGVLVFPSDSTTESSLIYLSRESEGQDLNQQGHYLEGLGEENYSGYLFPIGSIVEFTCGTDASFSTGLRVIKQMVSGGGLHPYSTWYETPFAPYPDVVGPGGPGPNGDQFPIGTIASVYASPAVQAASGEMVSFVNGVGLCQIVTQTPHGMLPGQNAVIATIYTGWNGPGPKPALQNSVWNNQQVSVIVIDPVTIQFRIRLNPNLVSGIVNMVPLIGLVAPLPFNGLQPGTILTRPVFSQADLVIDLTQADIADALSVLESSQGGLRVSGLQTYFFNLTWDFSAPTAIPSFSVPTITGMTVLPNLNGINWGVSTGTPSGYRVEIKDTKTGAIINKFTIDHPYNQQLLTQFEMLTTDAEKARIVTVTPFDVLGDGYASVTVWPGASGGSGGYGTAYPECIDVRMFGAVGDGVTDDTAAIQSALNTATSAAVQLSVTGGPPTVLQTIVCIPSSMVCLVTPQFLDQTPTSNGFGPTAVCLKIGSGTTLRVDGQLLLGPPTNIGLIGVPWTILENNQAYTNVDQDILIEGTGTFNCSAISTALTVGITKLPVANVHSQAMRVAGGQAYLVDGFNQILYRIDLTRPKIVATSFPYEAYTGQDVGGFSQIEVDNWGNVYMGLGGVGNLGELICMDPVSLGIISAGGTNPFCASHLLDEPDYCSCQGAESPCIGNPGDIVHVPYAGGYIASVDRIQVCEFNDVAVFQQGSLKMIGQATCAEGVVLGIKNQAGDAGWFLYGGCGLSTPGTPSMSADPNGNVFVLVASLGTPLYMTICPMSAGTITSGGPCGCCCPGPTSFCENTTFPPYKTTSVVDISGTVPNTGDHCIGLCPDGTQMIATTGFGGSQTKIWKYDISTNSFTVFDLSAYSPLFDRHSFKSIDQNTGYMMIRGHDSFIQFNTISMTVVGVYSNIAAQAASQGYTIAAGQAGQSEYDPTTASVVFNFSNQAFKIGLGQSAVAGLNGAIKLQGVQNSEVTGVQIIQSSSYGVYLAGCVASIIDNIVMPADFTQVGFGVLVDKSSGCSIVNCSINGQNNQYNLLAFVADFGSLGTLVDQNLVVAIGGSGVTRSSIGFEDLAPGPQYSGLTISNNVFEGGTNSQAAIIAVVGSASGSLDYGIAIRSNTIVGNAQTAIQIGNVADCQVFGNLIENNTLGITKVAGSVLVEVAIRENVVAGNTGYDIPIPTALNSPIYVDGTSTCTLYSPATDPQTYQSWAPAPPLIENSTAGLSGYVFPPEPPNSLYGVQPQTGLQDGIVIAQSGTAAQISISPFSILWTDARLSYAGPVDVLGQPVLLTGASSYTTYYVFVDDPYRNADPNTVQYGLTTNPTDLATSAGRYYLGSIQLLPGGGGIGTQGGALPASTLVPTQQPYDIGCTWQGLIPAGTVVLHLPMVREISFAANYVPSSGHLLTPPAANWTLAILKNTPPYTAPVQIGTIQFLLGSTFANFSGGPVTFNQLDILEVQTQTPADISASDLGFILSAFRGFLIPDPAIQVYLTDDNESNWQDAITFGGVPALTEILSDSLNNWNDVIGLGFSLVQLILSDNMSFWQDLFQRPGSLVLGLSDSLNNWQDFIPSKVFGWSLIVTETINYWADTLAHS